MKWQWRPSAEETARADAEPWDGPLAHLARPMNDRAMREVTVAGGVLYLLAASVNLLYLVQKPHGSYSGPGWINAALSILTAAWCFLAPALVSASLLRRVFTLVALVALLLPGVAVTFALLEGGPGQIVAIYMEAPIFAFYLLRPLVASMFVVLVGAEYLAVVLEHPHVDPFPPATLWWGVVSTVVGTGIVVGLIARRIDLAGNVAQRARDELADLNTTLETRVAEQVAQLESAGRLRRFVSAPVADAITAGQSDVLAPHRRRIAVFFCDLRGFTAFTNSAEPEEVVEILDEYYRCVGTLLRAHHGTVGDYAGDGIMAYFGDPVPTPSPAVDAVRTALELRPQLDALTADWQRRGYRLGYGASIAYGYATLGTVGFDGRYDYTATGAVVNLASRLCDKADHGQILIDHATRISIGEGYTAEEVSGLALKGFDSPVRVYALTGATKAGRPRPRPVSSSDPT